ncbi:MAG: DUF937 domain-containing protein [Rhodomicrobium sp.]
MSVNLVSLVSEFLTPDLIGRIVTALGIDRSIVGRAAIALGPAILGSLSHAASTPEGARKLANTVSQQSPSILDTLGSMIGGAGQQTLVKDGVNTLGSLLGGSGVSALTGAVGRLTGISQGAGSSLIGILTPAVLGLLGKQQAAQGLDASGLARLLAAQKDNITAALPAGFGDMLRASGAPGFAAVGAQAPEPRRASPADGASQSSTWSWVLGAVAAAALAWWFFGPTRVAEQTKTTPQVAEQTKTAPAQVAGSLSVDGVDLKSSLKTGIDGLKTTLQGITDAASAKAALPPLEKEGKEFDKLRDLAGKLPMDGKTAFAALVAQLRPSIEDLFNKVLAIPGVGDIAKPVIDGLRVKLDALSKA